MMLSVLIVSYNVCYFLEHCLLSVRSAGSTLSATRGCEVEVLVWDNNSTDNSLPYLTPLFPEVRFLPAFENLGFSKANNRLLENASGKYILFLNPDTLVPEDCFIKVVELMEERPAAGACGVRMIDGSGSYLPESKRGYPGTWNALSKMTGLAGLFPRTRLFAGYYEGHLDADRNQEVAILSGAFMLARASVLKETGGFDERFFMYGEDIDLSYRITLSGYKNVYCAQTTVIHFKGESTWKDKEYFRRFYSAMILFVQKHFPGSVTGIYVAFLKLLIKLKAKRTSADDHANFPPTTKLVNVFPQGDMKSITRLLEVYRIDNATEAGDGIETDDGTLAGDDTKTDDSTKTSDSTETSDIAGTKKIKHILCAHKEKADVVIYCLGPDFSMSDLIEAQQADGALRKRIFHPDAGAIIGSDSKDSRGSIEIIRRN